MYANVPLCDPVHNYHVRANVFRVRCKCNANTCCVMYVCCILVIKMRLLGALHEGSTGVFMS